MEREPSVIKITNHALAAFTASTNNQLTRSTLSSWELLVGSSTSELRQLQDTKILYAVYTSLLKKAATQTLDPLQLATFEMISGAIVDALIRMFPKNVPVTPLIDEITEVHLDFIEQFKDDIDDGGSDGYSQSSRQEFLGYQFAGLVERTYSRVSKGLGSEFDNSPNAVSMRISNWVSPIYARLQRRFVRFLAGNVEERVEVMNSEGFDGLLKKILIEIAPKYELNQLSPSASANIVAELPSSSSVVGRSDPRHYPSWDLTDFIVKVLRNTMTSPSLPFLEAKVARLLQNNLSVRMRALGRPLEKIATRMAENSFRSSEGLDDKEMGMMESMLEIGHVSAAAVFSVWHVRYNLVGVPENPVEGYSGTLVKDYLRPVSIGDRNSTVEALPRSLRVNAVAAVDEVSITYNPDEELASAALLAHAVRVTAAEEFRALITYNSDPSEWPASRDASFVAVFSSVMLEALTQPTFNRLALYQNLIAMAALEETIGVREPRAACTLSYETALKNAVLLLLSEGKADASPEDFSSRVATLESALGMMSRLPESSGGRLRMVAFKSVIDSVLSQASETQSSTAAGLKLIESMYPSIATMLAIDLKQSAAYVAPMGRSIFDKSVGSMLLRTEITGMASTKSSEEASNMGIMLRDQVTELGKDLMLSSDETDERTGYLAGAVFESLLETALEEYRRLNVDRAEIAMLRAYGLSKHPLLEVLQKLVSAHYIYSLTLSPHATNASSETEFRRHTFSRGKDDHGATRR